MQIFLLFLLTENEDKDVGGPSRAQSLSPLPPVLLRQCDPDTGVTPNSLREPFKLRWEAWESAQLTTAIAAILLSEQMGVNVELVPPGDNDYGFQVYEDITTGRMHAAFEVWPTGKEDEFERFASFNASAAAALGAFYREGGRRIQNLRWSQ